MLGVVAAQQRSHRGAMLHRCSTEGRLYQLHATEVLHGALPVVFKHERYAQNGIAWILH